MNIPQTVMPVLYAAIPLLFAITLHEVAHGYAARLCGDPTAAEEGRLSLNPLRHIDAFGTVLLPLVLWLLPPHVAFGYAKPVPVEFERLRKPRLHMAVVALAGPAANFVMGLGWTLLGMLTSSPVINAMVIAGVSLNAAMFIFNLLPIPPLDGGRVVESMLPPALAKAYGSIENYTIPLLIAFVVVVQSHVADDELLFAIGIVRTLFDVLMSPFNLFLN